MARSSELTLKDIWIVLFGFACVVGLAAGVYYAIKLAVIDLGLETSVFWAAVLALITWFFQNRHQSKRHRQQLLAERKQQQYTEFLGFINKYIEIGKQGSIAEPDLQELRLWSLRLGLIGSDEVVRSWNKFRKASGVDADHTENRIPNMVAVSGRLLLAMRKDSGQDVTKLSQRDMLRLFINDIDDVLDGQSENQSGETIDA